MPGRKFPKRAPPPLATNQSTLTFRSLARQSPIPPKSYCNGKLPPVERAACGLLRPGYPGRRFSALPLAKASRALLLLLLLQLPPPPPPPLPPAAGPRRRTRVFATHRDAHPAAASQLLKDKGRARRCYPAAPQPTTSRLICIRAAIGYANEPRRQFDPSWNPAENQRKWAGPGSGLVPRGGAEGAGSGQDPVWPDPLFLQEPGPGRKDFFLGGGYRGLRGGHPLGCL